MRKLNSDGHVNWTCHRHWLLANLIEIVILSFIYMNYNIMTLEHSSTWSFRGVCLPTSGLVVFGPLPAQINIHSAKKIKQNLQAWIRQNSIKDSFCPSHFQHLHIPPANRDTAEGQKYPSFQASTRLVSWRSLQLHRCLMEDQQDSW